MVRVELITFTTFSKQRMTLILALVALSAYFLDQGWGTSGLRGHYKALEITWSGPAEALGVS